MSRQGFKERRDYVHAVVTRLAAVWNNEKRNGSGLRSVFRRWRPGGDAEPTMEMRARIWTHSPRVPDSTEKETAPTEDRLKLIDQAATLAAFRAMAGDHAGNGRTLGGAMQAAGFTDVRMLRFLSTPREMRIEAMIRVLQRIDRENVAIAWTLQEVGNILNFLYGDEETVRWAANIWAGEFFRTYGNEPADTVTTTETDQESH